MKLTEGHTPWSGLDINKLNFPQLENKQSCDVVIIGGGISGALTSYVLTKQGIETILLEKGHIGTGSSSANTGLFQFMNDDPLSELIQSFGEKKGVGFYKMCEQAVENLSKIANHLSFDTDFRRRSSLYYATSEDDAGKIRNEYDTLTRHGFNVEYWNQEQIKSFFPFSKPAAIYSSNDAEANPLKLIQTLIYDAVKQGLKVFENSGVETVTYSDKNVTVMTKSGIIEAKTIIWATGYVTQDWKPDRLASLDSTYAIITEPIQDLSSWHERALIWETNRPYLYMRTTLDNRILVGGLDEPLTPAGLNQNKITLNGQKLLNKLQELFPTFGDISISHSWAGVFATSKDGVPMIGRHPDYPHSYFIEGYGGNGTVYSMLAADLLAEAVSGKEPEVLNWFSFKRPLKINASG